MTWMMCSDNIMGFGPGGVSRIYDYFGAADYDGY